MDGVPDGKDEYLEVSEYAPMMRESDADAINRLCFIFIIINIIAKNNRRSIISLCFKHTHMVVQHCEYCAKPVESMQCLRAGYPTVNAVG